MEPLFFPYGETETRALAAADPALGALMARLGPIERTVIPDVFTALVDSITGQQISGRAQQTVMARVREACGALPDAPLSPNALRALPEEALRACGLSGRKVTYLRAAAEAASDGLLDADVLRTMPDNAVIAALTALPGVGVWTAEMLLLFSLRRPNVLSFGDFGIRRGLCLLHGHTELPKPLFEAYRARYSPYGSVASLYLWELANPAR